MYEKMFPRKETTISSWKRNYQNTMDCRKYFVCSTTSWSVRQIFFLRNIVTRTSSEMEQNRCTKESSSEQFLRSIICTIWQLAATPPPSKLDFQWATTTSTTACGVNAPTDLPNTSLISIVTYSTNYAHIRVHLHTMGVSWRPHFVKELWVIYHR